MPTCTLHGSPIIYTAEACPACRQIEIMEEAAARIKQLKKDIVTLKSLYKQFQGLTSELNKALLEQGADIALERKALEELAKDFCMKVSCSRCECLHECTAYGRPSGIIDYYQAKAKEALAGDLIAVIENEG